jgi:hypothetical protein
MPRRQQAQQPNNPFIETFGANLCGTPATTAHTHTPHQSPHRNAKQASFVSKLMKADFCKRCVCLCLCVYTHLKVRFASLSFWLGNGPLWRPKQHSIQIKAFLI